MAKTKPKKIGRPVKWETPEAVQEVIDKYFIDCKADERHPTVTGLALELDLTRQGLINYEAKGDFLDTIKKAKQRVQIAVEETLMGGRAPVGAIFNLKNNFGWVDKTETAITGKVEMNFNFGGKDNA